MGLDGKALLLWLFNGTRDDLADPAELFVGPRDELTRLRALVPGLLQARESRTARYSLPDQSCSVTLLHVGSRKDDFEQPPLCVDQEMPLPPLYVPAGIIAARPPSLVGLDRLAIQDGRAGGRGASRLFANLLAQRGVDRLPSAIVALAAKITICCLPWR